MSSSTISRTTPSNHTDSGSPGLGSSAVSATPSSLQSDKAPVTPTDSPPCSAPQSPGLCSSIPSHPSAGRPGPTTAVNCPSPRLDPLADEDSSDLLLSFEPLSLLDSLPVYTYMVDGGPASDQDDDHLSPGGRKKQLFLQRLERRGLSHSDPSISHPSILH